MALAPLLAVLLACAPARAQERTKLITTPEERAFEGAVAEALGALRPGARAAPTIGSPRPVAATGWLDANTYLAPYGLKVDRSCLAYENAAYPAAPAKLVAAVQAMHAAVQNCAATRVLPATVGLIYDYMPRTTVACDPRSCEYSDKTVHAAACADHDKGVIYFKLANEYPWPTVIFHELMHRTRQVDNEEFEYHSHPDKYPLRDEVYFWERHCFDPNALVGLLRSESRSRFRERNLSALVPEHRAVYRQLAFDACAIPLRTQERKNRPTFNGREVEAVCGNYAQYLAMETNLVSQMWGLMPELFAGSGVAAPAAPDQLDAWAQKTCAVYTPDESRWNPVGLVWACASRKPELAAVAARAKLVLDGPGGYEKFMDGSATSDARLRQALTGVLAGCAKEPLAGSPLCRELTPESPLLRLMGRLILFWDPKTL